MTATVRHERWLLYGMSAAAIALAVTLLTVLVTSQRADKQERLDAEAAAERRQARVLNEIELVLEEVREEQAASARAREEFRRAVLIIFDALEVAQDRAGVFEESSPSASPRVSAEPSPRAQRSPTPRPAPAVRATPTPRSSPGPTRVVVVPQPTPQPTPRPPWRPTPTPTSPPPSTRPGPLPIPLPTLTLPCLPIVGCAGLP